VERAIERSGEAKTDMETQQIYFTDRAALERDCEMQFFRGTGPGGQNRNKVETAVRLVHRPTGLMVTAEEHRTQRANREAAYARMADQLEEMQRPEIPRLATKPTAGSRERRLDTKRRSSAIKRLRSERFDE
jgi:protein subunit release factor B